MKKKPNILWIMSDQVNADCLGCYGSKDCKTPNIDKLAEHGVRFDRAYTTSAICMPSRLTYLSGQYAKTHGFTYNTNTDNPDPRLAITNYLRDKAGYSSGAVGKMHIGGWDAQIFDNTAFSFGSTQPNKYRQYLKDQGLFEKETAWTKDDYVHFMLSQSGVPYEHSQPVWTAKKTNEMIDGFKEPFFLWTSFSKPHAPYNLPPDPPVKYDPASLTLPPIDIGAYHSKPFSARLGVENIWDIESAGEEKFREGLAAYYTLISMTDDAIGRIYRHLEEKKLLEDTVIIYCSDHGDFAGEHGQIAKNTVGGGHEPIFRVPLICYWKGHTGKEVVRSLVDNTDFFPTVCDLVGVDTPAWVQGESYARPVVMSGSTGCAPPFEGKDSILMEYYGVHKTVRTQNHKLSYCFDGAERGEMYDLVKDPNEFNNLFDSPEHRHVRERLLRTLVNNLIKTEQPKCWAPCTKRPDWRWYKQFPESMPEKPQTGRVRPH